MIIESETRVEQLTVPFTVVVTPDGMFHTELVDQELEAESLAQLQRLVRTAVIASRHSVPFVHEGGRRGVIRGFHATQRMMLITWANGEKDSISPHARVFKGDVDQAVVDEIRQLQEQAAAIHDRLAELRTATVHAEKLFQKEAGLNGETS